MRASTLLALLALLLAGCASPAARTAAPTPPPTTPGSPSTTTSHRTTAPRPKPTQKPTEKPTAAKPPTTSTQPTRRKPSREPAPPRPKAPTLKGDARNSFAFAPLSNPGDVTVEGSVPSHRAWSTSKVLVVAAFLDTVADGDPNRLTADQRRAITRSLTESHMDSVIWLRDQIPGSPGAAINTVLRSVGDTTTFAPDRSQGSMQWTARQQVKFMAALHAGRVVSRAASAHILEAMQPIASHQWGLGTVGADAFKGGWLTGETETRQMGILDGYAVAIITAGDGPAVLQSDGDSAHVQKMNELAKLLKARLADQ
jgi:hypothetical protein